tara:strand:+ start:647 stop:1138 length:492 start_codon:yes stop_codon:yes gene_type:complete
MSRGIKWTKEEEELLLKITNATEFESVAYAVESVAGNKRSAHATKMKWKKLQQTKVIAEETQTSSGWDAKKDFFLLVNFYDMSIDEVRGYFGCSYAECAGRLEQLIDSTELTHIELVRKAAMTVRERKEPYIPKIPSSRKEKRIIAKMNKLNDKLMRLRGGEE